MCIKNIFFNTIATFFRWGEGGTYLPKVQKQTWNILLIPHLFLWHLGNVHSKSGTMFFFSITFSDIWHIATKNNTRQINFQNNTSCCHGYQCMVIIYDSIFLSLFSFTQLYFHTFLNHRQHSTPHHKHDVWQYLHNPLPTLSPAPPAQINTYSQVPWQ